MFYFFQWKEPVHRAGIFHDDSLLINAGGKRGQKMEGEKGHEYDPETQIQSQQTNSEPKRKTEGRGRRRKKHERTSSKGGTQKDEAAGGITNELATYAESWASSNWGGQSSLTPWDCPGLDPRWDLVDIRRTGAQQLNRRFWSKGDRRATAIKASSGPVEYRWSQTQQGTAPPHPFHPLPLPAQPSPSPSYCLHHGFDLIITLRRVRRVRCRMKSRKRWKRTCLSSHMFGVSPHPIWETMRVSVYRLVSNGRDEELLLISTRAVLCAVLVWAPLSLPYGDFPL